jgi:hypothetical protein
MATRRTGSATDSLGIFNGGLTPAQRIMQSQIAQTPGAFNYADLDKKYPTRQVTPMVPTYIQQKLDEDLLEQKEQLATQRYREAQASIYESQLNEKLQTADQVILAREAFSQLNPQDKDYPDKRDKIFMDLPFAENDTSFMKSVVGRNDRLYENYFKKNIAVQNLTLKDLDDSYKTIQAIEESAANRGGLSPMEKDLINMHRARIKGGIQQQGITSNKPTQQINGQEDADVAQARNLVSRRPELKDEVNKRLISAGKQPIP